MLGLANLSNANLSNANLSRTYLYNADLHNANLSGANLKDAFGYNFGNLRNEILEKQAKSLKGATMPDGSIHP